MDWNTIILLASALSLAACLNESGAGEFIVDTIIGLTGQNISALAVFAFVACLASLMANLISTSATTTILVPISIYLGEKIGVDPRLFAISIAVFANIVYATPTSSPPNSMTLTAGYKFVDYLKTGGLLNVLSLIMLIIFYGVFYSF